MSQTETRPEQAEGKTGLTELAGKYLTFRLAVEEYGIEILKVMEIIKLMDITAVPRTPHYVRGVINLRGKVIPVIDLRQKFGMETVEDTDETCIIVVNVSRDGSDVQMGILVDTVSEVLDIEGNEIEPAPKFGSAVSTEFILGMAKAKGQVKILLDIDSILTGADLEKLIES
ncbi:MAG: chemotaxis protein CheW [Candidatus Sumerlaeia bacterium]